MIDDEDIPLVEMPKQQGPEAGGMLRKAGRERRRVGRPKKSKANVGTEIVKPNASVWHQVLLRVKRENKAWLAAQAAKHYSSMGQVFDDIIDCIRRGEHIQIGVHTPTFITRAAQAERKRKARLAKAEKIQKTVEHEENFGTPASDSGDPFDV